MSNIQIIIFSSLVAATPLIAAALGGLFSERSGVVNIGLEGMMTLGAFAGTAGIIVLERNAAISSVSYTILGIHFNLVLILGVLIGALFGGLLALLHAYLTVTVKIDQTVSGVAINTVALAFSLYLAQVFFSSQQTPNFTTIRSTYFGGNIYGITILVLLLVIGTWFVMNKTAFGMHIDAVGENPQAADSMGIKVERIRYQAVIISGILAGIAGIAVSLTLTSNFSGTTIAGKGFIALAVMLFGRRNPWGILGAGLFFGLTTTASTVAKIIYPNLPINDVYFIILPYVLTIIALTIFSRRTTDPKALGQAYDKEIR